MQRSQLLSLFIVLSVGVCFAQSLTDFRSQGATSQGTAADCSDPSLAGRATCSAAQAQRSGSTPGRDSTSPPLLHPVLGTHTRSSTDQHLVSPAPLNPLPRPHPNIPIKQETDVEQIV